MIRITCVLCKNGIVLVVTENNKTNEKFFRKLRKKIFAVIKHKFFWFSFVLVMMLIVLVQFDIEEAFESLGKIHWWIIVLVIGLQGIAQFVLYYQWCVVSRASGIKVKYSDMCYLNSQGYIVESVTPGAKIGGEVTRAIQLKNFGKCGMSKAISAVALQKLFSIGVFVFITIVSISYMILGSLFFESIAIKIAIYILPAIILTFIVLCFALPHKIKKRFFTIEPDDKKPHKFKKFMANMLDTVISVRNRPKAWIPVLLLCAFDWLVYPLNVIIIAKQIMPGADILFLTGAVFVSYMVAMLPLFPGGLGGFEPTLTSLLVLGGFALPDALCIAIVFRLTSFWFTILLSGVTIGTYKVFRKGKNKQGKNEQKISKMDSECLDIT